MKRKEKKNVHPHSAFRRVTRLDGKVSCNTKGGEEEEKTLLNPSKKRLWLWHLTAASGCTRRRRQTGRGERNNTKQRQGSDSTFWQAKIEHCVPITSSARAVRVWGMQCAILLLHCIIACHKNKRIESWRSLAASQSLQRRRRRRRRRGRV